MPRVGPPRSSSSRPRFRVVAVLLLLLVFLVLQLLLLCCQSQRSWQRPRNYRYISCSTMGRKGDDGYDPSASEDAAGRSEAPIDEILADSKNARPGNYFFENKNETTPRAGPLRWSPAAAAAASPNTTTTTTAITARLSHTSHTVQASTSAVVSSPSHAEKDSQHHHLHQGKEITAASSLYQKSIMSTQERQRKNSGEKKQPRESSSSSGNSSPAARKREEQQQQKPRGGGSDRSAVTKSSQEPAAAAAKEQPPGGAKQRRAARKASPLALRLAMKQQQQQQQRSASATRQRLAQQKQQQQSTDVVGDDGDSTFAKNSGSSSSRSSRRSTVIAAAAGPENQYSASPASSSAVSPRVNTQVSSGTDSGSSSIRSKQQQQHEQHGSTRMLSPGGLGPPLLEKCSAAATATATDDTVDGERGSSSNSSRRRRSQSPGFQEFSALRKKIAQNTSSPKTREGESSSSASPLLLRLAATTTTTTGDKTTRTTATTATATAAAISVSRTPSNSVHQQQQTPSSSSSSVSSPLKDHHHPRSTSSTRRRFMATRQRFQHPPEQQQQQQQKIPSQPTALSSTDSISSSCSPEKKKTSNKQKIKKEEDDNDDAWTRTTKHTGRRALAPVTTTRTVEETTTTRATVVAVAASRPSVVAERRLEKVRRQRQRSLSATRGGVSTNDNASRSRSSNSSMDSGQEEKQRRSESIPRSTRRPRGQEQEEQQQSTTTAAAAADASSSPSLLRAADVAVILSRQVGGGGSASLRNSTKSRTDLMRRARAQSKERAQSRDRQRNDTAVAATMERKRSSDDDDDYGGNGCESSESDASSIGGKLLKKYSNDSDSSLGKNLLSKLDDVEKKLISKLACSPSKTTSQKRRIVVSSGSRYSPGEDNDHQTRMSAAAPDSSSVDKNSSSNMSNDDTHSRQYSAPVVDDNDNLLADGPRSPPKIRSSMSRATSAATKLPSLSPATSPTLLEAQTVKREQHDNEESHEGTATAAEEEVSPSPFAVVESPIQTHLTSLQREEALFAGASQSASSSPARQGQEQQIDETPTLSPAVAAAQSPPLPSGQQQGEEEKELPAICTMRKEEEGTCYKSISPSATTEGTAQHVMEVNQKVHEASQSPVVGWSDTTQTVQEKQQKEEPQSSLVPVAEPDCTTAFSLNQEEQVRNQEKPSLSSSLDSEPQQHNSLELFPSPQPFTPPLVPEKQAHHQQQEDSAPLSLVESLVSSPSLAEKEVQAQQQKDESIYYPDSKMPVVVATKDEVLSSSTRTTSSPDEQEQAQEQKVLQSPPNPAQHQQEQPHQEEDYITTLPLVLPLPSALPGFQQEQPEEQNGEVELSQYQKLTDNNTTTSSLTPNLAQQKTQHGPEQPEEASSPSPPEAVSPADVPIRPAEDQNEQQQQQHEEETSPPGRTVSPSKRSFSPKRTCLSKKAPDSQLAASPTKGSNPLPIRRYTPAQIATLNDTDLTVPFATKESVAHVRSKLRPTGVLKGIKTTTSAEKGEENETVSHASNVETSINGTPARDEFLEPNVQQESGPLRDAELAQRIDAIIFDHKLPEQTIVNTIVRKLSVESSPGQQQTAKSSSGPFSLDNNAAGSPTNETKQREEEAPFKTRRAHGKVDPQTQSSQSARIKPLGTGRPRQTHCSPGATDTLDLREMKSLGSILSQSSSAESTLLDVRSSDTIVEDDNEVDPWKETNEADNAPGQGTISKELEGRPACDPEASNRPEMSALPMLACIESDQREEVNSPSADYFSDSDSDDELDVLQAVAQAMGTYPPPPPPSIPKEKLHYKSRSSPSLETCSSAISKQEVVKPTIRLPPLHRSATPPPPPPPPGKKKKRNRHTRIVPTSAHDACPGRAKKPTIPPTEQTSKFNAADSQQTGLGCDDGTLNNFHSFWLNQADGEAVMSAVNFDTSGITADADEKKTDETPADETTSTRDKPSKQMVDPPFALHVEQNSSPSLPSEAIKPRTDRADVLGETANDGDVQACSDTVIEARDSGEQNDSTSTPTRRKDKTDYKSGNHFEESVSASIYSTDPLSSSSLKEPPNSPASNSVVGVEGTTMAEKIDIARLVIARKLDEQVSPAHHSPVGAFSSWSETQNSTKASNRVPFSVNLSSPQQTPRASIYESQKETPRAKTRTDKRLIVPASHPSPFESAISYRPHILSYILGFLGDPVMVSRAKELSKACYEYVDENEHELMQAAVRLGGMSMNTRPAFWLWVTLGKFGAPKLAGPTVAMEAGLRRRDELVKLERIGRSGKWHSVIERDVHRAFGNLPPHKTGARLRTDSIVRALVTWGKGRTIKTGVRGTFDPPPVSRDPSTDYDSDDMGLAPTDTVSDWGGVSPVGSFTNNSFSSDTEKDKISFNAVKKESRSKRTDDEMALSGNSLTEETKKILQTKLSFVLHALSAAHSDIGYCQGMDYVVAHLLRILQETVRWSAARGTLPKAIQSAPKASRLTPGMGEDVIADLFAEVDRSLVIEEACFRMMDTFFTCYNLGHFYYPELRCLKTCCLVFEKLIQIKLPTLADHFEHHDLSVGLFALGWFQTLFLYLPSMPTATVCHMWDIWLVERSYKIFFRVGTAILFLSQPILLNHELEGMMSYLNTFPDATLLSPDILIACALQIKVTNGMLMELEQQVAQNGS